MLSNISRKSENGDISRVATVSGEKSKRTGGYASDAEFAMDLKAVLEKESGLRLSKEQLKAAVDNIDALLRQLV